MANVNGRKGSAAESAVADYLSGFFPGTERRVRSGAKDRGDINIPGMPVVVEVKDVARIDLAGWLQEAHIEAGHADANMGVVWSKRRGRGNPKDWYFIADGYTGAQLLLAYHRYLYPSRANPTAGTYASFNEASTFIDPAGHDG